MRETLALEKALGSVDSLANRPATAEAAERRGGASRNCAIGAFFSAAQSLLDALNGEVGGRAGWEFSRAGVANAIEEPGLQAFLELRTVCRLTPS